MTQEERLDFLIRSLQRESGAAAQPLPASLAERRQLLRALMNLRPPAPASKAFLAVQDAYLQERLAQRGVTRLDDLTPAGPGRYLWQGDITTLAVDAIVNAANHQMLGCFVPCHGCIDNSIPVQITHRFITLRRASALLSGVLYCPLCGKPLRVVPESNRWSNGKPCFKYVCPGFRKKTCTFKAVDGVQMDEFIVEQLSKLSDQKSPYYSELASTKFTHLLRADTGELEYHETKKAIERTQAAIAAQVRNMRQADSNIRKYIQEDIEELSKELEKK